MPIEHVIKLVYQLQLTSDNINTWKKGVVTALKRYLTVSYTHLNFSSMEEKCREKLILFHDAETVIYDGDDEVISKVIRCV